MRWFLAGLLLTAGCKETTAGACRRYIASYNACAQDLGDGTILTLGLTADVYCAAYTLPGIPKDPDATAAFNCLADAYDDADCSSDEAYAASFDATCDEVPEE